MATYFVSRTGDGTNGTADPGTSGSWSTALATLGAAVTAATTAGDVIKVSDEHYEDLSADATYTIAASIRIIVVDHQDTSVASTMDMTNSYIGNKSTNRGITFTTTSPYLYYIRGLALYIIGGDFMDFHGAGTHVEIEDCSLRTGNGGLRLGFSDKDCFVRLTNCSLSIQATTGIGILVLCKAELVNVTTTLEGSLSGALFYSNLADPGGAELRAIGCDFSDVTGTLVGDTSTQAGSIFLHQCSLGSGVTILGSQTNAGTAGWAVYLYDCSAGDEHYHFGYYDSLGSLTIDTGIYANDGAEYVSSGTKHSWKIVPSTSATFWHPFTTPWISVHNETVSPTTISPSLEALSATSGLDESVIWSEWIYKGTDNSTKASLDTSDNGGAILTPSTTDQATGALSESGWTETGTNYTYKLAPDAALTAYEIGDVAVRVCCAYPGSALTVYVDPQIRGLS